MNFAQLSQTKSEPDLISNLDSGLLVPHKGFQNLSVTAPGAATTYGGPQPWGLEHGPGLFHGDGEEWLKDLQEVLHVWFVLWIPETSWNQLVDPADVGICWDLHETSKYIKHHQTFCKSLLGLPVEHQKLSETSTDRSWPKTPRWIPADWFSFGVSWCFQRNSISSSDSGWYRDSTTLGYTDMNGKIWTRAARMYPGQWSKHPLNSVKRGCMRMLTTMLNKVIVGHGSSPSLKRHTSQFSDLLSSRTLHRNSSVCSKGFCKCGKYTTWTEHQWTLWISQQICHDPSQATSLMITTSAWPGLKAVSVNSRSTQSKTCQDSKM